MSAPNAIPARLPNKKPTPSRHKLVKRPIKKSPWLTVWYATFTTLTGETISFVFTHPKAVTEYQSSIKTAGITAPRQSRASNLFLKEFIVFPDSITRLKRLILPPTLKTKLYPTQGSIQHHTNQTNHKNAHNH